MRELKSGHMVFGRNIEDLVVDDNAQKFESRSNDLLAGLTNTT